MKKILQILFFSLFVTNISNSETDNKKITEKSMEEKRAQFILLNMQQDYITCYSFYKIGAEYVKKSNGDNSIIQEIEKSANTSLKLAHETGEIMDMTTNNMSKKVKSEIKNQLKLIDNNFNNASILLEKYAKQCKKIIEDKKQRISFWEKKTKNKFQ
jgi:hypothetical protein